MGSVPVNALFDKSKCINLFRPFEKDVKHAKPSIRLFCKSSASRLDKWLKEYGIMPEKWLWCKDNSTSAVILPIVSGRGPNTYYLITRVGRSVPENILLSIRKSVRLVRCDTHVGILPERKLSCRNTSFNVSIRYISEGTSPCR